jgi:hypothetical protein
MIQKEAKHTSMKEVEDCEECDLATVTRDYWQKLKVKTSIMVQGTEPEPVSCETFAVTLRLSTKKEHGEHVKSLAPPDASFGDLVTIFITVVSDQHDQNAQHSQRNLEIARGILKERCPWIKRLIVHSDGAGNYKKTYAAKCAADMKSDKGLARVIAHYHNEPGHGGDVCDTQGFLLAQAVRSAAKNQWEEASITATQVVSLAQDIIQLGKKLKGHIVVQAEHPAGVKEENGTVIELQSGSRDVLAKTFPGDGSMRVFRLFGIGEGKLNSWKVIATLRTTTRRKRQWLKKRWVLNGLCSRPREGQ